MFQLFVDLVIISVVVLVIGGGDIFARTVTSGMERGRRQNFRKHSESDPIVWGRRGGLLTGSSVGSEGGPGG